MEHAIKRNAPILGELAGYGATDDAFHITQPSEGGTGAIKAMDIALNAAQINANEDNYINAHGTSTPINDKTEAAGKLQTIKKPYVNCLLYTSPSPRDS